MLAAARRNNSASATALARRVLSIHGFDDNYPFETIVNTIAADPAAFFVLKPAKFDACGEVLIKKEEVVSEEAKEDGGPEGSGLPVGEEGKEGWKDDVDYEVMLKAPHRSALYVGYAYLSLAAILDDPDVRTLVQCERVTAASYAVKLEANRLISGRVRPPPLAPATSQHPHSRPPPPTPQEESEQDDEVQDEVGDNIDGDNIVDDTNTKGSAKDKPADPKDDDAKDKLCLHGRRRRRGGAEGMHTAVEEAKESLGRLSDAAGGLVEAWIKDIVNRLDARMRAV